LLAVSKTVATEQKVALQDFAVVGELNCHYSVSMARKDRLFSLIQILRDGNLYRACDLAELVGVSLRTLYRDMYTLAASGVPIRGERGLGYQITAAYTLPALNLTKTELEALHLGLAAVGESEDAELSAAAKALSRRVDGVLPEDSAAASGWSFATYPFADAARGFQHMPKLRQAIRSKQLMQITLGAQTLRLRPLALDYWGRLWTLAAWDESAQDFITLRVDKITRLDAMPAVFVDEPGKSLVDYLAWNKHPDRSRHRS
jgi:predicted DNA-binding transcriptional regulator YafY